MFLRIRSSMFQSTVSESSTEDFINGSHHHHFQTSHSKGGPMSPYSPINLPRLQSLPRNCKKVNSVKYTSSSSNSHHINHGSSSSNSNNNSNSNSNSNNNSPRSNNSSPSNSAPASPTSQCDMSSSWHHTTSNDNHNHTNNNSHNNNNNNNQNNKNRRGSSSPRILSITPRLRTPSSPTGTISTSTIITPPPPPVINIPKFTTATPTGFSFSRSDLGGVDSPFFSEHNIPTLNTVNWLVPDCLAFGAFPFNRDLIHRWKTRDASVLNYDSYEPYTDMDRACKFIASKFDVIVNLVPENEFSTCEFEPTDYRQVLNQFRVARPQWIAPVSSLSPRRQAPPDLVFLDYPISSDSLRLTKLDEETYWREVEQLQLQQLQQMSRVMTPRSPTGSGESGETSVDAKQEQQQTTQSSNTSHLNGTRVMRKLDETYRLLDKIATEISNLIIFHRKRVLIHSTDGVCRAAVVAGIVLSQVYQLERENPLVRLQATHDCRSETFKKQLVIGEWIHNVLQMFPPAHMPSNSQLLFGNSALVMGGSGGGSNGGGDRGSSGGHGNLSLLLSTSAPSTFASQHQQQMHHHTSPFVDLGISTPRASPRPQSSSSSSSSSSTSVQPQSSQSLSQSSPRDCAKSLDLTKGSPCCCDESPLSSSMSSPPMQNKRSSFLRKLPSIFYRNKSHKSSTDILTSGTSFDGTVPHVTQQSSSAPNLLSRSESSCTLSGTMSAGTMSSKDECFEIEIMDIDSEGGGTSDTDTD